MSSKEYLNINGAVINSTVLTLVPLAIIFVTPNVWWGFFIKGLCVLWLFGSLWNLFYHPMWSRVIGFGAGITLNMLWFSLIWFLQPHWIIFIFIFLFLSGLGTMRKMLGKHYYDEKHSDGG